MSTSDTFLSWVRNGIATAVTSAPAAGIPRRASIKVGVKVNGAFIQDVLFQMYGPGDVTGIDPRIVVRTTPAHGSTDFEPNYFPSVEFTDAAFPWLFTPAGTSDQRLTPWICLAVVRKQADVLFEEPDPKQPLPVLVFKGAARPLDELPPLDEAWGWAHTHVLWAREGGAGADEDRIAAILRDRPELARSRLVCPRRLEPGAHYYACVVPVFDLGVKAGLGLMSAADESAGTLQLAWTTAAPPPLPFRLPVYFRWEFTAGAAGDFESLVRRIVRRTTLPGVGERLMDVSRAGPQALEMPGVVLGLEGALHPAGWKPRAWDPEMRRRFETALRPLLDAGALAATSASAGEPVVAPPLYGQAQTNRQTVPPASDPLGWMHTLNLDPRARAASAFGTAVVQRDQEALVASAWAQLAEVRRLNAIRRRAQLAREIAGVAHRERFSALSAPAMLAVARPVLTRVGTADPSPAGLAAVAAPVSTGVQHLAAARTFHAWLADSAIGAGAVSPAFQSISRPGGPIARRLFAPAAPVRAEVVKRLNARRIVAAPPRTLPDKAVTIEEVSQRLAADNADYANVKLATARPEVFVPDMPGWADGWQYHNVSSPLDGGLRVARLPAAMMRDDGEYEPRPPRLPTDGVLRTRLNTEFNAAARRHQQYLLGGLGLVAQPAAPPPRDIDAMRRQLLLSLQPERTMLRWVQGQVESAPATVWQGEDPLDQVLVSPQYAQPMSEPLRQLSPELLLPGAANVPPDTLAVLTPNHAFIEAYLAGLNHEITRELIWRGFPGDVAGTSFRYFWPANLSASSPPPPECPNGEDVPPIRNWRGRPLGGNVCGTSARSPLILLVRSSVLQRYPSASIYAVGAVSTPSGRAPGPVQVLPLFRQSIDPDIALLGFGFTEAQAKGSGIGADLGYYFVIQQHLGSPVFGLAAQRHPGELSNWRALSWDDIPPAASNLRPMHLRLSAAVPMPTVTEDLFWGANAANMAGITQRMPVRVARHFSLILSPSA